MHSIVLNVKRIKVARGSPPQKLTRLEIREEDEGSFEFCRSLKCLACQTSLDESVAQQAVDAVMNALSAKAQSQVKAWAEEIVACAHSRDLVQIPREQKGTMKCTNCELSENNWLCLTCGNIGCGRQQFGGIGGNGHALAHFETTGHPMTVKLGTITPEGTADVFCYACGEERLNPHLSRHLSTFGINVATQQKTEKSLGEMVCLFLCEPMKLQQLEYNVTFDFSMKTKDGKDYEPMHGPGLTGLKNLGNSCYMASALQCLFSLSHFGQRYYEELFDHPLVCYEPAFDCFHCQMRKMADGLVSGRYSLASDSSQGISPSMFKDLVGKGHPEFASMRQQDTSEFISHFLSLVEKKERGMVQTADPSKAFAFGIEQRIQCTRCKGVKYKKSNDMALNLFVPYHGTEESVDFQTCLDHYFGEIMGEGYHCVKCQEKTNIQSSVRIEKYPDVLMVVLKRFVIGDDYVMKKLNVPIKPPMDLVLDAYRAQGPQPDEDLLPEDADESSVSAVPQVDQDALNQLLQMGFPETRCIRALHENGNNVETAMNWIFERMDDPSIDEPFVAQTSQQESQGSGSPAEVGMLMDMGFTDKQAKRALKECGGNMERAVDWLFSHADDPMDQSEDEPNAPQTTEEKDVKPAKYTLKSFISHRGTSTHCGHYVAHVRKEPGTWVLFNDEKVARVPEEDIGAAIGEGYVYFFTRDKN